MALRRRTELEAEKPNRAQRSVLRWGDTVGGVTEDAGGGVRRTLGEEVEQEGLVRKSVRLGQ